MRDVSKGAKTPLRFRRRRALEDQVSSGSVGLPADLLKASVKRLRVVALVYAFVFFSAAIFPNVLCRIFALVNEEVVCQTGYFTTLRMIGPPLLSILCGITVFLLVRMPSLSAAAKLNIGLVFEVLGSIGIAAAEYQGIISAVRYQGMEDLGGVGGFGLSWVSIWVMFYTVVIPSPPRRALLAATLSVAAVPTAFAVYSWLGLTVVPLRPVGFFLALVFPYLLVVSMAFVAARVVYHLGTELRRARELGSYRLVELLGEGGMGEVWRAEHRLLARPAAVKLIRPEALGVNQSERGTMLQRFEREAQATASMRCPHTVELFDFGVADDGTFYYVMELLEGLDLDRLIRRFGPAPPERVAPMLIQACESLAEAHAVGLIHRDIKPANIHACRYGSRTDWIKVLDFGLVKQMDGQETLDPKLTAENTVRGTPAFMAPEQVLGRKVDARSDLYALGCVAYWLLTSEQVFTGKAATETMMRHVNDEPVLPSYRLGVAIPSDLELTVMNCLAKEPADRPQSADAVISMLHQVSFAQPWTRTRSDEWWEANLPHIAADTHSASNDINTSRDR